MRTRGGLEIGTYGYRVLPPFLDTETASISVLLGSRHPYKVSISVQREGIGNRTSMDTETQVYLIKCSQYQGFVKIVKTIAYNFRANLQQTG